MKYLWRIILIFLLLAAMPVAVPAASGVTDVEGQATAAQDGSCRINLAVTLHLDDPAESVTFPLPGEATEVLLNGNTATTRISGEKLLVALPELAAGDYRFTLSYCLPSVVTQEGESAMLTLPLLSGFGYPIENMEISVTLPGEIQAEPGFVSGYHQENIASDLSVEIQGDTLQIRLLRPLMDHETLTMTLPTQASLFSDMQKQMRMPDFWDIIVVLCLVLAVVYYVLRLRPQFAARTRCCVPPEGMHAGEVGMCLTGTGIDLTLMVLSWAQLGYIQLELRDKRKLLLHKRMDMGNERREYEVQMFRSLFRGRRVVDGTGMHYAKLCRQTAMHRPQFRQMFRPGSGRLAVFRLLSCAAGCFSGVKLGLAISEQPTRSVLLAIVCCLLCGIFSYLIQGGGKCLPLRNKRPLILALCCSAAWIGLGVLTGRSGRVVPMVLFQLICGVAIAYGGRRSELGKRSLAQIWGLRRYMLSANAFELQHRLQNNANFYYELAPYALALGVDRRFARKFGKTALPESGYIICKNHPRTAVEWAALLRQITDLMNARQKRLPHERLSHP